MTCTSILLVGVLVATAGQTSAGAAAPKDALTIAANQWTKVAEVAPDIYGRELEPGRGAYWCFDPASGAFLRYGGYTPTDDNGLWSFDLAARKWTNLLKVDYAWPAPQDRPGAGAWWSTAYDAKRKVIWLCGGDGLVTRSQPKLIADIWQYDPAAKSFKAMQSKGFPGFSSGCRIVYDVKNDLIIRSPGYDGEWGALHNRDQTWVYDPNKNAWGARKTPGSPKSASGGVWVFDPVLGKTVFGALTGDGGPMVTWTFDAASDTWAQMKTETAPVARVYCGACYDSDNKLIVVYGGVGRGSQGYAHRGGGAVLNDTWTLDTAKGVWTKLETAPVIPKLPGGSEGRFILPVAMDYDAKSKAVVVSAPAFGVWALRLAPAGGSLPELKLAALPEPEKPLAVPEQGLFPQAPLNKKLVDLEPNKWVRLGGGPSVGGGEVPMTYDESTGLCLRYGGCNDGGTTFASGYGNDLTAYDPATERWLALRWTDPCGPPRPGNGCTRQYAYDPVRKVTWFGATTAGNRLASSLPPDWKTGAGTWKYDGLRDRFTLVPSTGPLPVAGVVCAYDRVNNLFLAMVKQTWANANMYQFDPEKAVWTVKGKNISDQYTFGCFVDTLKGLLVVEGTKEARTTKLYDAATGDWREMKPTTDLPQDIGGRPTLAYDRDQDVVLGLFTAKTYIYSVKDNAWTAIETPPPGKAGECLVYDTRHKVFIATEAMSEWAWAFRYKK